MRPSQALLISALAASVNAHGLIVSIQGANGVTMPGLSGEYLPLPKAPQPSHASH